MFTAAWHPPGKQQLLRPVPLRALGRCPPKSSSPTPHRGVAGGRGPALLWEFGGWQEKGSLGPDAPRGGDTWGAHSVSITLLRNLLEVPIPWPHPRTEPQTLGADPAIGFNQPSWDGDAHLGLRTTALKHGTSARECAQSTLSSPRLTPWLLSVRRGNKKEWNWSSEVTGY